MTSSSEALRPARGDRGRIQTWRRIESRSRARGPPAARLFSPTPSPLLCPSPASSFANSSTRSAEALARYSRDNPLSAALLLGDNFYPAVRTRLAHRILHAHALRGQGALRAALHPLRSQGLGLGDGRGRRPLRVGAMRGERHFDGLHALEPGCTSVARLTAAGNLRRRPLASVRGHLRGCVQRQRAGGHPLFCRSWKPRCDLAPAARLGPGEIRPRPLVEVEGTRGRRRGAA